MGRGTFVGDAVRDVGKAFKDPVGSVTRAFKDPIGTAKETAKNPFAMTLPAATGSSTVLINSGSSAVSAPPKKEGAGSAGVAGAGGAASSAGVARGMSAVEGAIGGMPDIPNAPEAPTRADAADKAKLLVYGDRKKRTDTILTSGKGDKGPVKTRGIFKADDTAAAEKLGKGLRSILGA